MEGQQVALSVRLRVIDGPDRTARKRAPDTYQADLAVEQRLESPRKAVEPYGLTSTERATLRPDLQHCAR